MSPDTALRRRLSQHAVQGRWSLTAPLFADAPSHGPRMRAIAELLLERHGIVTREAVLAEGIPGGFAGLYSELTNLETLGTAGVQERRGLVVLPPHDPAQVGDPDRGLEELERAQQRPVERGVEPVGRERGEMMFG